MKHKDYQKNKPVSLTLGCQTSPIKNTHSICYGNGRPGAGTEKKLSIKKQVFSTAPMSMSDRPVNNDIIPRHSQPLICRGRFEHLFK